MMKCVLRNRIILLFCLSFFLLFQPVKTFAHRVTVFAWVDGDRIHTESKFSGQRKVKQGKIIVKDPAGKILLTGKTDEKGEFSFPVPKKSDLIIVVEAGTGHRGEWIVRASELGVTDDVKEGAGNSDTTVPVSVPPENRVTEKRIQEPDEERLRRIVGTEIETKIRPLLRTLAEMRANMEEPSMKDILGGIGYILGLVGIGAYFNNRRRVPPDKERE